MKIRLTIDGRSYSGSPRNIVTNLRRDAKFTTTLDLNEYIETMTARLKADGWGVEVQDGPLDERCESLLDALITCGFILLVEPAESRTGL